MGKGFDYRGATVLAAGMVADRGGNVAIAWADRGGNVVVADYRVQVEPWVAAAKADITRRIRNLKKRRARAVLREAVEA